MDAPPAVDHHLDAGGLSVPHLQQPVGGIVVEAEAELGQPDSLLGHFTEVLSGQDRLQDDRTTVHLHPVGAVVGPRPLGEHGEGLHALGVVRAAGEVDLAR